MNLFLFQLYSSVGIESFSIYCFHNSYKEFNFALNKISGLPWWLSVKESPINAGTTGEVVLIHESGRSPGEENDNALQYSCQKISMD